MCAEAGKRVRILLWRFVRLLRREHVAIRCEVDRWRHILLQGEFAEVALRIDQAGDGTGNPGGLITNRREVGNYVPLVVQVHVAGGGSGSLFAIVEEVSLTVLCRGSA